MLTYSTKHSSLKKKRNMHFYIDDKPPKLETQTVSTVRWKRQHIQRMENIYQVKLSPTTKTKWKKEHSCQLSPIFYHLYKLLLQDVLQITELRAFSSPRLIHLSSAPQQHPTGSSSHNSIVLNTQHQGKEKRKCWVMKIWRAQFWRGFFSLYLYLKKKDFKPFLSGVVCHWKKNLRKKLRKSCLLLPES